MKEVGSIVYFEQWGGDINHGTITKRTIEYDANEPYNLYYIVLSNGETSFIEEHNCLSEDNPKVQEYITKMNTGLWLARGIDNRLTCHIQKPQLYESCWYSACIMAVPETWYPEVTFENSPKKLKL